ncbi:hypothetical protein BFR57_03615 [Idiomarina sp. MD25a]|uniref:hypothetical protein n=1 Tax=Idiomarina sp. MD25a TaxID=1889913 RepID=UPI0008F9779E|nr:hypothetical protein [Idiomarina sp. MD25a]OIM99664.1 hypothetical protein BFR57_03615 [Idiomarina sp. MD25a]
MSKTSLSSHQADYQYICHELAHHWTPFANAMSHDYWMMESFAEYISAQQLKRRFGEQLLNKIGEITSATTQAWFTKQLGQGERK